MDLKIKDPKSKVHTAAHTTYVCATKPVILLQPVQPHPDHILRNNAAKAPYKRTPFVKNPPFHPHRNRCPRRCAVRFFKCLHHSSCFHFWREYCRHVIECICHYQYQHSTNQIAPIDMPLVRKEKEEGKKRWKKRRGKKAHVSAEKTPDAM